MTNPEEPQLPDPTAPPPAVPESAPFPPPPAPYPPPPSAPGGYPPPTYAPQPTEPQQPAYGQQPPYGQPPGYGQPYPPPGYPPQPGQYGAYPPPGPTGYAPPPKKRRKWPWIVGGTVVVVVAALIVIGVVFGRKGSSDPHTAADKFWHALAQHDIKGAQKYVCSGKDLTSNSDFTTLVNGLTSYDIGAESGSGNTRTYPVTLHLSIGGQTGDPVVITTVKKDTGEWYVCDLATQ